MRGRVVRVGVGDARERLDRLVDVAEPLVQHADVVERDHVAGIGLTTRPNSSQRLLEIAEVEERARQAVERRHRGRIVLQRLAAALGALGEATAPVVRDSELEMGVGQGFIQIHGALEGADRLVELAEVVVRLAEVEVAPADSPDCA